MVKTLILPVLIIAGGLISGCKKDPCKDLDCNNGYCADGSCICPTGYEGSECNIESRSKVYGAYTGDYTCNAMEPFTATFTISAGHNGIFSIAISDGGTTFQGLLNDNAIQIAEQSFPPDMTISGSGQILNNTLTLSLDVDGFQCSFAGSR